MVKSGSQLPVAIGAAGDLRRRRARPRRPGGDHLAERPTEEFENVATGRAYDCVEGQVLAPLAR